MVYKGIGNGQRKHSTGFVYFVGKTGEHGIIREWFLQSFSFLGGKGFANTLIFHIQLVVRFIKEKEKKSLLGTYCSAAIKMDITEK